MQWGACQYIMDEALPGEQRYIPLRATGVEQNDWKVWESNGAMASEASVKKLRKESCFYSPCRKRNAYSSSNGSGPVWVEDVSICTFRPCYPVKNNSGANSGTIQRLTDFKKKMSFFCLFSKVGMAWISEGEGLANWTHLGRFAHHYFCKAVSESVVSISLCAGIRGGLTQPDRPFFVGDESENSLTNVTVCLYHLLQAAKQTH